MNEPSRPSSGGAYPSELPGAPLDVAIVGAGRVGCSIGRALLAAGHRVVAATVAHPDSAKRVLDALGHVPLVGPEDAALSASVVVCAVPDDALADAASRVAAGMQPGGVVVHTSGISGADVLTACGPNVAAIHPAQTIPEPTTDLAGVFFGVTAPEHMKSWAAWFVGELGGTPVDIPEGSRVLYHAALAMASNFTVAIAGDAADLLGDRAMLAPLIAQSVENVARLGADQALTGPIVRGDAGTVRKHLAALTVGAPKLIESYVANARRTLDRAVSSGRLDAATARAVAEALEEALVR
ncbi:MAG: Rossmann-like and DUF2520 domain-containing protein [Actinomycetota bacterium]